MSKVAVSRAMRCRVVAAMAVVLVGFAAVAPSGPLEAATPAGASAGVTESVLMPQAKPSKPTKVTAKAGDRRITVRWKKPASNGGKPVTGYTVQLRAPGGDWTTVKTTGPAARSRVLRGLTNGTVYKVRVGARNADGNGKFSAAVAAALPTSLHVAIGLGHVCAVEPDGEVACWGANEAGQLGTGDTTPSTTPAAVASIDSAVAVTAGWSHSCALLRSGQVWCWGINSSGELGNPETDPAMTPVRVPGVADAIAVVAGASHTCALLESGQIWCWGWGAHGQLGRGVFESSATPAAVTGITSARAIAAGDRHTCALVSRGRVMCWGENAFGQLGLGGFFNSSKNTPQYVPGVVGASAISAGSNTSCAVITAGAAKCWGDNLSGGLGNGETGTEENSAVDVIGLTGATSIAVGRFHTCAVRTTGRVLCWGSNVFGQIGNGGKDMVDGPTATVGSGKAVQVAAGGNSTCARTRSGVMRCWGDTALVGTVVDASQVGVPVRPDGF